MDFAFEPRTSPTPREAYENELLHLRIAASSRLKSELSAIASGFSKNPDGFPIDVIKSMVDLGEWLFFEYLENEKQNNLNNIGRDIELLSEYQSFIIRLSIDIQHILLPVYPLDACSGLCQ